MAESSGERTEKATPRRHEKARERGQVARSLEVNAAVLLAVGLTALVLLGGHFGRVLGRNGSYLLGQAHVLQVDNPAGLQLLLMGNLQVFGWALAPLVGAILVAALLANVAQVGLQVTPAAMAPRPEKLNPLTGMKRFFQKRTFFELVKNLLKIGVLSLLALVTIRSLLGEMNATPLLALPDVLAVGRHGFVQLVARLLAVMFVLAIVDWFWQRRQHEDSLKMSKHEIKQEGKDMEGDPQIKARVRGLQMEMARKRMLTAVPQADVVVTNPTHLAVALKYERGAAAPVVVAKGADHLAGIIRKIARESRVPVIENKPVARALYEVPLGKPVPESLFQSVAEILAYVYRLRKA
ncbi:MAG: flagellar biosynthesis protein FlhB [Candidatus Krumholzibacteriia bacterium]